MKTTTQQVLWCGPAGGDREYATRRVSVEKKPRRVWTLYRHMDETSAPVLPYTPRHHVNAFLEDFVHDWDWSSGSLRYYSRVVGAQEGIWLLLEY